MASFKITEMRREFAPNEIRTFAHDEFPEATLGDYADIGMTVAEDADVDGVLAQAGFTPLQYLQFPLNKPIEILTTPQVSDKITGRSIVASWETEDIVQPIVEGAGVPQLYGDDNDTPLASFTNDFEIRKVQRFELGLRVGKLEDARMAKMNVLGYKSPYDTKRGWLAKSFELLRDEIAFRGIQNGAGITSGIFTDPNRMATITLPSAKAWTDGSQTFQTITRDIRAMFAELNDKTDSHFDGMAGDECQLVLTPKAKNALTISNEYGKTALEWLKENYSGCEVIASPRNRNAFGAGSDGALLIAKNLNGNKVIDQFIPAQMRLLGVFKSEKHIKEAYTFATAGVMLKQPLGAVYAMGV